MRISDWSSDVCSSDLARRRAALLAVNALGVLAAGHLQAPRRAGELHALVGRGRHVLQRDAAAADQVRRTGQDLQRGDPAGQRGQEALVLRPHRSEEHTSELQSLMLISYAALFLKQITNQHTT